MKKQGWLFLIFIIFLLCPPCRFSHAAAAQNAVYVVRMNDKAMIEKDGVATASSLRRKTSLYTAKWDKHTKNRADGKTLTFPISENLNWIQYQSINFWVYSEKKTDASIAVYLENTQNGSKPWRYQYSHFKADFKGWKKISIDLADMNPVRFGSMKGIDRIGFSAYGWDCVPNAETVLYIDDIYLVPIAADDRMPETKADFQALKDSLKSYLIGNGTADQRPEETARIAAIDRRCKDLLGSMAESEDAPSLWGNSVPHSTAALSTDYTNLYTMAQAYASPRSSYYKDAALGERLRFGLSWMHTHRYGEAEWREEGWYTAVTADNWWDWMIGAPTALVHTLAVTDGLVPQEERQQYLADISRFVPQVGMNDSNKACITYVVLASAILAEDSVRFADGYDAAQRLFYYTDRDVRYSTGMQEGFYSDGSYLFHGRHPMNGTYGLEHYKSLASLAVILDRGGCGFLGEQLTMAKEWFENAFLPLCHDGAIMSIVRGRYPGMERESGTTLAGALADFSAALPENDAAKIKAYLKELMQNKAVLTENLNGSQVDTLLQIADDETLPPWQKQHGVTVYPFMDRAVWHGDGFSAGLAMSSSRIYNYESISGCNQNGWYMGDGMLLYYQDGFSGYDADYWKSANPYRRPGTTVDEQQRELVSIPNANAYLSDKDFVGGAATANGAAGVCAMELQSYHSDKSADGLAPHDSDLTAKKSWFMFENELVALGSGISATQDSMTETVIENQKIGTGGKLYINGRSIFPGAAAAINNVSWVSVDNRYGYYFPQEETLQVRRSGAYAEMWKEHGIKPQNARCAYVLLPNRDRAAVQAYTEDPKIRIVKNEETVQAVKNEESNVCGMVFYKGGALAEGVFAENPCIVILEETPDVCNLTVAAPDHTTKSVTLRLQRTGLIPVRAETGTKVWEENGSTYITVDTGAQDGKSHHLTLQKQASVRLRIIENTDGVFWIAYDNRGGAETTLPIGIAIYDTDGVLRQYRTESVTVAENQTYAHRIKNTQKRGRTMRGFVWEDADRLIPAKAVQPGDSE